MESQVNSATGSDVGRAHLRSDGSESAPTAVFIVALLLATIVLEPGMIPDPERFSYPKELVLNTAAFLGAGLVLWRTRVVCADALDLVLGALLVVGTLSASLAGNHWLALRAESLVWSGVLIIWTARALDERSRFRVIPLGITVAVGLAAIVACCEAYGLTGALSLPGRAPGGVFGNRNRMAHFLVIGLPTVFYWYLTAGTRVLRVLVAGIIVLSAAALTLSRTRAAWAAFAGSIALAVLVGWTSARRGRGYAARSRELLVIGALLLLGVGGAVLLPNRLTWDSDTPYRESLSRVGEWKTGSGRVRFIQDINTSRMISTNPLFGVGPGNWAVAYPRFASPDDPSYNPRLRVPTNRLPNSDWFGFAAEQGICALVLALAAALLIFGSLSRAMRAPDAADRTRALTLGATLLGTAILGISDPVLLTPVPLFALSLLVGAWVPRTALRVRVPLPSGLRVLLVVLGIFVGARPVTYTARALWSHMISDSSSDVPALEDAVRWDPGNFEAEAQLAELWARRKRCDVAVPYAIQAYRLFPTSAAPLGVLVECRVTRPVSLLPHNHFPH